MMRHLPAACYVCSATAVRSASLRRHGCSLLISKLASISGSTYRYQQTFPVFPKGPRRRSHKDGYHLPDSEDPVAVSDEFISF